MKGPKVIIAKSFNHPDGGKCYYFSEEAIRELLREEYEQANNIICFASNARKPLEEGIIEVEKSIESAIIKLKAKINEQGGEE